MRRLAAIALGWMKRREAAGPLHAALVDESGDQAVRVAAAMSLMRLFPVRPATPPPATQPDEPAAASTQPAPPKPPKLHSAGAKD